MAVSEKQKQYADKYIKNTFDEIKLRVPKGRKAVIQDYAATKGESLNGFLNRLIDQTITLENKDGEENAQTQNIP